MADLELINSIHSIELDIDETKSKIKTIREQLTQSVEELDEARELQELLDRVKSARAALKSAISDDNICSALTADLDEERFKLKDQQEILSYHLVQYRENSQATYVEDTESSKVRPILMTAKLGKPEFHQEAMTFEGKMAAANDR